jgi:hypothetical protein
MTKRTSLTVTVEEGQTLFLQSAVFQLPDKLGEGNSFPITERSVAADEVRSLWRELKGHSPIYQKARRQVVFGPVEAWEEVVGENGASGWKLKKPETTVELKLPDEAVSGIVWCLLLAVHPESKTVENLGKQDDICWPVAQKIRKTTALRELLKLSTSTRRTFADDPAEKAEDVSAK